MKKLTILILLAFALTLFGQNGIETFNPSYKIPSLFGHSSLLNPNKLKMNHSVFFLGGVSSNQQSFYESTYTNHLQYNFNPKLKLKVDLNFVNFGTASFDNNWNIEGNNDNSTQVLPNFSLDYRPTENSRITIQFNQYDRNRYFWDWDH
ncbi:MAG TPA: hypothetical protein DHM37_03945 [Candidatus Cloacimonas sp.]|nr:hypothetical protein [Candidatus Cloacimonas sp.]